MTNVSEEWTRCGPQEISKLARRLRARRQRRIVVGTGLLAACASVALVVWLYPRPDRGPDFAGISCERVMDLSDAYMKSQLAPEVQDQVRRHIALCPNCRPMFESMPPVSHRPSRHGHEPADDAPLEVAHRIAPR
jgi:hypothetical protein